MFFDEYERLFVLSPGQTIKRNWSPEPTMHKNNERNKLPQTQGAVLKLFTLYELRQATMWHTTGGFGMALGSLIYFRSFKQGLYHQATVRLPFR